MRRAALAVLIALILAGPASAQSKTQATTLPAPPPAKEAAPDLRGSGPAIASPRPLIAAPDVPAVRPRPADAALMSPNLASPAAPRLTRDIEAAPGGGGQCRTKCAQELYFCQAADDGGVCDDTWRKCVLACPTQSGDLR